MAIGYYEQIRLETEDRRCRLAARIELQRQLHEAEPRKHSLMIPVDDDEFPCESWTAGWAQEPGA
jgi:hypothetical protein